jgi:hypothetical protein
MATACALAIISLFIFGLASMPGPNQIHYLLIMVVANAGMIGLSAF